MSELSKCDGCGQLTDANLLDAVLLDPDGNQASDQAYCRWCFPKFVRVAHDTWQSNYGRTVLMQGGGE